MTLEAKINKFIRSIEFNSDGSLSVNIRQEFEITLEDGSVTKVPHSGELVVLTIDDPRAKAIAEMFSPAFYPAFLEYWAWYKAKNPL